MFKLGITLFLLSVSILQCGPYSQKPQNIKTEIGDEINFQTFFEICDDRGFAQVDGWLNPIYEPFIVRKIRGRLIWEGGWHEKYPPLFEIRPTGKGTRIRGIHANADGNFVMKNVPEGQYCFRASCRGWQSYMGIIIVDKKADPKNEIVVKMDISH